MLKKKSLMINKAYNYAIIWASNNQEKYWFKVYKDMLDKGYKVFPVNPKWDDILWQPSYTDISKIDEKIDVAIFITPPAVSLQVLQTLKKLDITKARFQPGASDQECITFCENHWIECLYDACMLISS